ncbi:uncharacterized protein LOC135369385 isoform X2 [Ornithodoros turicata]|uniref:uncharacterized protein LOC135369385 isoform X2 n=1 Tax=Ornithodoros turicata TaxID=34597 RepID=UPI0031386463
MSKRTASYNAKLSEQSEAQHRPWTGTVIIVTAVICLWGAATAVPVVFFWAELVQRGITKAPAKPTIVDNWDDIFSDTPEETFLPIFDDDSELLSTPVGDKSTRSTAPQSTKPFKPKAEAAPKENTTLKNGIHQADSLSTNVSGATTPAKDITNSTLTTVSRAELASTIYQRNGSNSFRGPTASTSNFTTRSNAIGITADNSTKPYMSVATYGDQEISDSAHSTNLPGPSTRLHTRYSTARKGKKANDSEREATTMVGGLQQTTGPFSAGEENVTLALTKTNDAEAFMIINSTQYPPVTSGNWTDTSKVRGLNTVTDNRDEVVTRVTQVPLSASSERPEVEYISESTYSELEVISMQATSRLEMTSPEAMEDSSEHTGFTATELEAVTTAPSITDATDSSDFTAL